MGKIETAVQFAIDIANNNYHGYSQSRRGDRDTDCSKIIIDGLKAAGFDTGAATFTGNMLAPILSEGFKDVTASVNLRTGDGLQRGDILLRPKTIRRGGHAAFFIGNGQIVQAQADYDGVYGDGNSREIRIQAYYDSPFIFVLRYPEITFSCGRNLKLISPMMRGEDVKGLQTALSSLGFACGVLDGIFGSKADAAVRAYQRGRGLVDDGIAGKRTITALGGSWTGN